MSGIGQIASKAQELVSALASAPMPDETPFVRNARPFAIYIGILALAIMGVLAVWLKDDVTTVAVTAGIGTVLQQFGAQRSGDKQASIKAAMEDKKTITSAAVGASS